jgi:hypothetical protein
LNSGTCKSDNKTDTGNFAEVKRSYSKLTGDPDLIIAGVLGSILKEYSVGEQIPDAQADPRRDLLNSLGSFIPLALGERSVGSGPAILSLTHHDHPDMCYHQKRK